MRGFLNLIVCFVMSGAITFVMACIDTGYAALEVRTLYWRWVATLLTLLYTQQWYAYRDLRKKVRRVVDASESFVDDYEAKEFGNALRARLSERDAEERLD